MNRQQKEVVLQTLKQDFLEVPASFLVGIKGMTVAQMQGLRRELRGKGGELKVAKNRLLKIAVKDVPGAQDLTPYLHSQIGVVFAQGDVSAVAKVLHSFCKVNQGFDIIAGRLDAKFLNKESVSFIATLPPREVLLGQVCGTIKAPMNNLVLLLNQLILRLLLVLNQIALKKSSE